MLRSFLLITIRVLWRNKVTSVVNVISLSVGIAAFMIIMLYVSHETGYDKFNRNYRCIYRLEADNYGKLPPFVGTLLKDRVPEIKDIALLADGGKWGKQFITYTPERDPGHSKQIEAALFWTNPSTFDVFTFPFLRGDPETALKDPMTIVLTESTAKKLFGSSDPLNQSIEYRNHQFLVTGIIRDVEQSHVTFDALLSQASYQTVYPIQFMNIKKIESYAFLWSGTYLLLADNAVPSQVENKINAALSEMNDGLHISVVFEAFHLRPLKDLYFEHNVQNLMYGLHGNAKMIQVLVGLGVFLLLLAAINYVNLTTARSTIRAKEVAVKRISGSSAGQMRLQLVVESILVSLASLVVAIAVIQLIIPWFNASDITNLQTINVNRPAVWGLAFGGSVLLGIIAGIYPAFYLTAIQPVRLMKGEGVKGSSGSIFRSILMTFQFALSIVMIVAIIVNARQLNYVRTADLGFIKDHVISVTTQTGIGEAGMKRNAFKEQLRQAGIDKITFCTGAPGFEEATAPMMELNGEKVTLKSFVADSDYLEVMGIQVLQGRGFSARFPADQIKWEPNTRVGGVLINETAVRELGIEDPIGQIFYQADSTRYQYEVVGVVKDFHFRSFHDNIEPLMIGWWDTPRQVAMIKLPSEDIAATLKKIEMAWREVYGQRPFSYKFLDENFDQQYKSDEQLAKLLGYFTGVAVVVACLGLFALSSFMVSRRTKEIGVRKTMGASGAAIYSMLSWDFLKWIFLAAVVASPPAWLLMDMWLSTFAYHITMGLDIFIVAGLIAVVIALLTVTGQSLNAARANPVDSLRHE